jgi:hypothetical protein
VQCSDVRRCGAVCLDVCVCYSLISASCSAGSERALLYRCAAAVAACVCVRVCVCGTALHWAVAAAVSGSSRAAAAGIRRSLRSNCDAVSCTSSCGCSVVASLHFDALPALLCASTPVMRAAVCLLYVSAAKRRRVLFCMCVPRGIHSLFAVAFLLLWVCACFHMPGFTAVAL